MNKPARSGLREGKLTRESFEQLTSGPRFYVAADIEYLDGDLVGLVIPSGQATTWGTEDAARHHQLWLARVRREGDFIRATGTGHRYKIVSEPTLAPMLPFPDSGRPNPTN